MAGFNNATHAMKSQIRRRNMAARIAPNWGAGVENPYTPINSHLLPNMPVGSRVEIAPDVYEIMDLINRKTIVDGIEVPFMLYGKTVGNRVYFNHIDADIENLSGTEARFSSLESDLQNFIASAPKDGSCIVAHGHTHPKTANWYHNFSVDDLDGYANMRNDNAVFRDGAIELCSVLLVDGQYNFLFYDPNYNEYYRFQDVYVGDKKLPSYGGPAYIGPTRGRGHE